ncbi:killer cell lectin-like receptor subfamily B member 1C [Paroedura picta]|uniref:killer cell lectin-like receptor subfamily B member 1C n=1 Tax=Paroedura picta TaxID=143630 RepID=UPI0040574061
MAENILYADLRLPSESTSARLPHPPQDSCPFSCRYKLALWIGWGSSAILLVTVILLVFQMKQTMEKDCQCPGPIKEIGNNSILAHLRQKLCKPLDNNITENSSCRLCPQHWNLHENKCYWISKEKQTWSKSKESCIAKHSRLLVIQNQEEVDFIESIMEGAQLLWIGLKATFPERKWIWLDDSAWDGIL